MGGTLCIGLAPTILAGVKEVVKPFLLANFQEGPLIFASLMIVFVKFWTPIYMRGSFGIDPVPIILGGAKDFVKHCLLANFQEINCISESFISIFVRFWTPLYITGTAGMGLVPILLRGAKDFVQHCLLANFREINCISASFTQIFVKFWTPLYMGSTPKYGPIAFIFKLDLLVVLKSICASFGSGKGKRKNICGRFLKQNWL